MDLNSQLRFSSSRRQMIVLSNDPRAKIRCSSDRSLRSVYDRWVRGSSPSIRPLSPASRSAVIAGRIAIRIRLIEAADGYDIRQPSLAGCWIDRCGFLVDNAVLLLGLAIFLGIPIEAASQCLPMPAVETVAVPARTLQNSKKISGGRF